MGTLTLSQWVSITAQSDMPLYAILSNVSDAMSVKNYYLTDGSQTPHGLFTGTPYSNWQSVMPMIVQLDEHSPFLDWINQTQYQDWGWLARSHLPFESICAHLRGLTQVIMPEGETVFFRYWDGAYLAEEIRFMAERWAEVLPAFAFYWINDEAFTVLVPVETSAQTSPWWHVPQALLDKLSSDHPELLVSDIMQYLQENYLELYRSFPKNVLEAKINHILSLSKRNNNELDFILQQLIRDK